MPPPTAPKAPTAAATAPPANGHAFTSFLLDRLAHNPFLINETPHSLSVTTSAVVSGSNSGNNSSISNGTPSTLDPAQRALLLHQSEAAVARSAADGAAAMALLQRALVDAPLLPVGGAHLLHELVWTNFVACAEAAKQVGCYTRALQLHDARARSESAAAPLQDKDRDSTADEPGTTAKSAGGSSLAESVFCASPLVSDAQMASPQGSQADTAPTRLRSCEELSVSVAPDVLRMRLAQAQTRLVELKEVLQRGVAKLRRLAQGLQAYDDTPIAELREQRQAAVRALLTSVTGPLTSTNDAAADELRTVVGEPDRKRPRTTA